MWQREIAVGCLIVTTLFACSDTVGLAGDGGAGGGVGGAGGVSANGGGGTEVTVGGGPGGGSTSSQSVSIGPIDVMPGEERTVCVSLDVGNADAGMLRTIRTHLTEGSHHLIVTKLDDTSEQTTPTPCSAFAHGGDALFIAEKPEMALTYPDGSGLPFTAHQIVGIEMHYINYTAAPIAIEGTVDFDLVPFVEGMKEVRLLFVGDPALSIPPMGDETVEGTFSVPGGAKVFAVTSHTHQLGVYASIHKTDGTTDTLLHESVSWAEPPFDVFAPPLEFNGNEGLKLRCDFHNPTNQTVNFGTSFYDEMCFLWAHYTVD